MPRTLPSPAEATNDAVRRLRELVRVRGYAQIARQLASDESTIRRYARERRRPHPEMMLRMRTVLGIAETSWDEPPSVDVYAAEPATTPVAPPTTRVP